jgi:hypothetical protein
MLSAQQGAESGSNRSAPVYEHGSRLFCGQLEGHHGMPEQEDIKSLTTKKDSEQAGAVLT